MNFTKKNEKVLLEVSINSCERIIFFDGVCNLCNSAVKTVYNFDKKQKFKFASLQEFFPNYDSFDSIIYVSTNTIYDKSDAALQIANELGGFFSLFSALKIVPKPLRDKAYDLISRNRYRIFGRKSECMIHTGDFSKRIITKKALN